MYCWLLSLEWKYQSIKAGSCGVLINLVSERELFLMTTGSDWECNQRMNERWAGVSEGRKESSHLVTFVTFLGLENWKEHFEIRSRNEVLIIWNIYRVLKSYRHLNFLFWKMTFFLRKFDKKANFLFTFCSLYRRSLYRRSLYPC